MNLKRILAVVCVTSTLAVSISAQEVVVDTLGGGKSIATSPADLLRGEISGVRVSSLDGSPNGQLNVNIRGLNTLRSDSQPLWIVDGAVIGSSINNNLNAFYLSGGTTSNGDVLNDYSGEYYASPLANFGWLSPYEIESIEVLKDISATAKYGMFGANGVIIVNTKRPKSGNRNIWLNSNVGVDFSSQNGNPFKTGIVTTHNVGINGIFGQGSYYNISGFVKYHDASVVNTNSITGGLAVNIAMTANEIFGFGFNSFLSYGDYVSASGTNFIGSPSTMTIARFPDGFTGGYADPINTLDSWNNSYDDEALDFRTVNSVWLKVNFLRGFYLKVTGGMDYENQNRYIWFGTGTSFGHKYNGATSILGNSLMNYNLTGELNFERNFSVKHHFKAGLAYDLNGNINKTNAMCGTEFRNPALRGKGLTSSGSLHVIRKFSRTYTQMGGYATVGYDYDGYAGLSAAARCDYTMQIDKKPLWFPSAEAFIDFKRIFIKNESVLSALRISGGYGWAGRETVLPYEYLPSYILQIPEVQPGSETYFDGVNRLISKEWNIGLNIGFMNNRFSLAVKYFDKYTDDAFSIINYGKIHTTEKDGVIKNGLWIKNSDWVVEQQRQSSIRNNGIEIDLNLQLLQMRNVRWGVYANASFNANVITSLDALDVVTQDIVDGQYITKNLSGMSIGQACGLNTLPKVHGGFGTTLSLYGFTLDARFSGAGGFHIINANKLVAENSPIRSVITAEDMERGDYLRLDCLSLAYDVPFRRVSWIDGLRVNISAHNLFTATDYSGWNPDVNSFGVNTRSYGVDYGSYPFRRSLVLGLSLKF